MHDTRQPPFLKHAENDGFIKFTGDGKTERVHYVAADHSERWADPEEKVRAEFWAELIYKYEYRPERIRFEVKVPRRTPGDLADLVIYGDKDDELKAPYLVFECKRADVSDAEFTQAIEQACGNRANLAAPFCGVIAGMTRRFLRFDDARKYPPGERDRNILADIPIRYGKPPAWRFYKGGFRMEKGKRVVATDLPAIPREELRAAIRKCHQTLWEGGRRSPITAFGEFCKLIFVKHRDEKNPEREDGQPYAFQRGDETAEHLANRIYKLYDDEKELDPTVFEGRINVEPPILAQVVEHLEGISLDRTELDTKGVAFEEFMGGFFKGVFGQYFAPRELIGFAVEVLNPERKQLVLDPACGSGGFLLYALDHVRREADRRFPTHRTDAKQSRNHWTFWHDFAEKNLFGVEINEELARVAKMNMIIHDDGHTNIVGHDALDFFQRPKDADGQPTGENRSYLYDRNKTLRAGKFDLILTNPPFGSVVKRTEKGEGYLEQFDLRNYIGKSATGTESNESAKGEADAKRGAKAVKERASIKTEILFLERVHSFLKPGTGRTAIVLPDGILTNSSLQGVRDWMLAHFQLLAVVSLPQFAFAHYDAGVKASLVFLRRLKDGETVPDSTPIFMALAENIGYDATGRKTFTVMVEKEEPGVEKIELQSCDLFDFRVHYEWNTASPKKADWSERHREIIPDTGLVARWRAFEKDPAPFFV
ncbi:MAG: N-6 DNA methylase [Verrucomicrobiota bacterium]